MNKKPLEKIEEFVQEAGDMVVEAVGNKKISYPVAGGAVGYAIGKKSGNEVTGAVVGAMVGALIARHGEKNEN